MPYVVDSIVCNLSIATARWKTEIGEAQSVEANYNSIHDSKEDSLL